MNLFGRYQEICTSTFCRTFDSYNKLIFSFDTNYFPGFIVLPPWLTYVLVTIRR